MKILIVCSGNSKSISPFIKEQAYFLTKKGIIVDFFLIKGNGLLGYLKNYIPLEHKIKKNKPDIVHAHYGLSGLLVGFQRIVPVIVTLHGSDVNKLFIRFFSYLAILLSRKTIFVSRDMAKKMFIKNAIIIPCGVDFSIFKPMNREKCRKKFSLDSQKKYILFSSRFDNPVKNFKLAQKAINEINNSHIEILELKNYSRLEVAELMNSVNLCLLTSHNEGSPQFIKEAMACNCPVVSTDVGDVREMFKDTEGCYLTSFDPEDVAFQILKALDFAENDRKTNRRKRIIELGLDTVTVAQKLTTMYNDVLLKNYGSLVNKKINENLN